ncbi:MAG: glutamine--fructose-6-phosphate transaminase (isomerizing) [Alphaproteobacteria bacterium]|nr:glutamine--fructose-6-phosphate transaminase (isomerizing) [Alphaproteobacteria bacterium]
MCGIIGILGEKDVAPLLVDGLKRLEYRGYDSAGIATLSNGHIDRCRASGKIVNLDEKLKANPLKGTTGIGHTRWATHGGPTENNAHPHATARVAVVHNGIIENYAALKAELERHQCRFETDTDTEVIAHLVDHYLTQGKSPREAANAALDRLEGAFAVALIFAGEHNLMIGARQGTPLAVGYGAGEMYLASDSYALAPFTKKICFLEDGDRAIVTREGAEIYVNDNQPVTRPVRITAQSGASTGKDGYRHFMLKEIHEQPAVIGDTLNSFINPATGEISVPEDILSALENIPRLTMIACGTAYYACMTAKYWFEKIARLPCEVDAASEFRYREAPMPEGGAALFVSQSGETLDTLEALRYSKREKQTILSIVNTIESTIERESDHVMRTLAGPEISVASTKATTAQLTVLACLVLALADRKGLLSPADKAAMTEALRHVPKLVADVLETQDSEIKALAEQLKDYKNAIYTSRGAFYPLAMEGAIKLKEISYIHAEGYAAGEFKHGPIALIDNDMPTLAIAPGSDPLFEKTASNIQEIAARGGKICLLSDAEGLSKMKNFSTWSLTMADIHPFAAPILYLVPLQLLAYHVAVAKGTDVDQPRNLAKSVTVE